MNPTYLILCIGCVICCLVCEHLEAKSKRWYQDRMLLRGSGFFLALAIVALGVGIAG